LGWLNSKFRDGLASGEAEANSHRRRHFVDACYLVSIHCADAEEAAAQGERIYENYCATCHGEQLQNSSSGLTSISAG